MEIVSLPSPDQAGPAAPARPFSVRSASSLVHDIVSRRDPQVDTTFDNSTTRLVAPYTTAEGDLRVAVIIDDGYRTLYRDPDQGHWELTDPPDNTGKCRGLATARTPDGRVWIVTLDDAGATFFIDTPAGPQFSAVDPGSFHGLTVAYTPPLPTRLPMGFLVDDAGNLQVVTYVPATLSWDLHQYDIGGALRSDSGGARPFSVVALNPSHFCIATLGGKSETYTQIVVGGSSVSGAAPAPAPSPDPGPAATRVVGGFIDDWTSFGGLFVDDHRTLCVYRKSGTDKLVSDVDEGLLTFDGGGLMHVYLRNWTTGVVRVLHQTGWGPAGPVWRSAANPATGKRVVTAIPLTGDVSGSLAAESFPADQPTLVAPYTPPDSVDNHRALRVLRQESVGQQWTDEPVQTPAGVYYRVTRWRTRAVLRDAHGAPIPNYSVRARALTRFDVEVGGQTVTLGPREESAVTLRTNSAGAVTFASRAHGLTPPEILLSADGLPADAALRPGRSVHDYLAGTGTLHGRPAFTGDTLAKATVNGRKLVPDTTWAQGLTPDQAVRFIQSVIAIADPNLPDPVKSGYLLRTAHDDRPGYQEFDTAEDMQAELDRWVTSERYGGFLDDVGEFFGDFATGVSSGAAKAVNILIDGGNRTAQLFLDVGGKLVDAGAFVIHTIEDAIVWVETALNALGTLAQDALDWFAHLFDFSAIWNTKTAIEQGLTRLPAVVAAQLDAVRNQVDSGLFDWLEHNLDDLFAQVTGRVGQAGVGDLRGSGSDPTPNLLAETVGTFLYAAEVAETIGSDVANWLWDKVAGPWLEPLAALLPTLAFPSVGSFGEPVQRLLTALGTVAGDVMAAAGAFTTWLTGELSGRDDRLDAIALDGLLDELHKLCSAVIQVVRTIVDVLFDALDAGTRAAGDMFATRIDLGVVDTVLDWILDGAGVPDSQRGPLTVGGLVSLLIAFPATFLFKAINGVDTQPFPDGRLPAPTGPGAARAGEEEPPSDGTIACYALSIATTLWVGGLQTVSDAIPASALSLTSVDSPELDPVRNLLGFLLVPSSFVLQMFLYPAEDLIPFGPIPTGEVKEQAALANWLVGCCIPTADLVFMAASLLNAASKKFGGGWRIAKYIDPVGLVTDTILGCGNVVAGITESATAHDDCARYVFNIAIPSMAALQFLRSGVTAQVRYGLLLAKVAASGVATVAGTVTRGMGWQPGPEPQRALTDRL